MNFCGGVLLLTGALKFLDVIKDSPYLQEGDVLLPFLTNKELMLMAGSLEIVVAMYVWISNSLQRRSFALLWFVITISVYKWGRTYMHATVPCSCLGVLGRALKLSSGWINFLTWLTLFVLAAPAVACLVHLGVCSDRGSLSVKVTPRVSL